MPAFLVLLSIVAITIQIFMGGADWVLLTSNWGISGIMSFLLWDFAEKYKLGRNVGQWLIAVPWVLLSATFNYCQRWLILDLPIWKYFLVFGVFYLIWYQGLRAWAETYSSGRMLFIGILIGLLSIFFPEAIFWLVFTLFIIYHMRIFSVRNLMSVISGVLLGIWFYLCIAYTLGFSNILSDLIENYTFRLELQMNKILVPDVWTWIVLVFTSLLIVVYLLRGMIPGSGSNLRSHASMMMTSTLSLLTVALMVLDFTHLDLYLPIEVLMLSFQMIISLSDNNSSVNEWWALSVLVLALLISVGPELWTFFEGLNYY